MSLPMVVLPQPLSPTTAMISPLSMVRFTPVKAWMVFFFRPAPLVNRMPASLSSISGGKTFYLLPVPTEGILLVVSQGDHFFQVAGDAVTDALFFQEASRSEAAARCQIQQVRRVSWNGRSFGNVVPQGRHRTDKAPAVGMGRAKEHILQLAIFHNLSGIHNRD